MTSIESFSQLVDMSSDLLVKLQVVSVVHDERGLPNVKASPVRIAGRGSGRTSIGCKPDAIG